MLGVGTISWIYNQQLYQLNSFDLKFKMIRKYDNNYIVDDDPYGT